MKIDKRRRCPVKNYAGQVVQGKIVTGKWVRLACQRHLDDLKNGKKRGLYFDRVASENAIHKIELFRHSKGEWGGQPLKLAPWQKFKIGSIFGWKRADGTRRFRLVYEEVARKNGKSTFLAGVCNYMFAFDGEPGADIFTAATKRDQARIIYDEAANMMRKVPQQWRLRQAVTIYNHSMVIPATCAKMQPLSADANSMDGLNPHLNAIDELHAHKTRAVFDVLNTATGARRQPLTYMITTAGWDRHSVCYDQHDYAKRVLEGVVEDDSLFAYIASIDEGDDWKDERVWIKANPNIGISVKIDDLRRKADVAKQMPSEQNTFLRLHLNVWTEQSERWIDLSAWDDCKSDFNLDDLKGRACYGGLDMSSTDDISAFVLVFPPEDAGEPWRFIPRFWIPAENMKSRIEKHRVPYDVWAREGLIIPTEGNVIDYNVVQHDILGSCETYDVQEIAFDRFNVTQMVTNLMGEGVEMVKFGQGFVSMSAPTKSLGDLIRSGQIAHDGNPAMRWMISNMAVKQDPAGNLKPDKEKSSEKIDGVVALVMGLGRAIIAETPGPSVYEERGILVL